MPVPRLDVITNQTIGTIGEAPTFHTQHDLPTLPGPAKPPSRRELAELGGIFRMRRLIEPELCAQACLLHTDADLDELTALAPNFADTSLPPEEIFRAHRDFHFRLLAPAATAWDFRVLLPLWQEADRCVRALLDQLGLHPARLPGGAPPCAELLDAFRTRDPEQARAASRRHLDLNARRVREFLTRAV
ncbi:MAG TPA: FCD domain-containing protein [Pseudonocardia sp.]|nr:FCD domain-containing protein [Pseudonocardia sp.]